MRFLVDYRAGFLVRKLGHVPSSRFSAGNPEEIRPRIMIAHHFCPSVRSASDMISPSCQVLNLRSIRPLDREAINKSVRKTSRLLVVEEGWPQHGVASEVM
jgi:hypothetical protein